MSDHRLRELERRWKQSGEAEDEAAYLAARVRSGDVDRERLLLAAYLGHGAAERVLNLLDDPVLRKAREDLYWVDMVRDRGRDPNNALHGLNAGREAERWNIERWTLRLERWGHEVCVRAAYAVGLRLQDQAATHALAQIVALLERCQEAPAFREEARARVRALFAGTAVGPSDALLGDFTQADAPLLLGLVLADPSPKRSAEALKTALETLVARGVASEEDLRRAVRKKLVPWALGYA